MKMITTNHTNPVWAWVGCNKWRVKAKKNKRILLAVMDDLVMGKYVCVEGRYEDSFLKGLDYNILNWEYAEIIKEPSFRAFKYFDELLSHLGIKEDVVSEICVKLRHKQTGLTDTKCFDCSTVARLKVIFESHTFQDGSPFGVLVEEDE